MGLDLQYFNGQTALDAEEMDELRIPSITSRGELNEFEQQNIESAVQWTMSRSFKVDDVLSEDFIKDLHTRMFADVWTWAGAFRLTNKNIGVDKHEISVELRKLIEDCRFWIERHTYPEDEIAIRFKHRLVAIHCFPNGNGRHARLMADVLIEKILDQPVFTWGGVALFLPGEARAAYLDALRKADAGNIQPLIAFARS